MAPTLLDLPHEVLHAICSHVDAEDLLQLSCCRTIYRFLKTNTLLYKEVYLKRFDEPQHRIEGDDWEMLVRNMVWMRRVLDNVDEDYDDESLKKVFTTVKYLLQTAKKQDPISTGGRNGYPKNQEWLAEHLSSDHHKQRLLAGSSLFNWASTYAWGKKKLLESGVIEGDAVGFGMQMMWSSSPDFTAWPRLPMGFDRSQLLAKLHVLYGVPVQEGLCRPDSSNKPSRYSLRSDTIAMHPYARSRTYDMRQHTQTTLWGPFRDASPLQVDWEKLEAVMMILDHNIKYFASQSEFSSRGEIWHSSAVPNWTIPFLGASPWSYVSQSPSSAPAPTPSCPTATSSAALTSPSTSITSSLPNEPSIPLDARDPYGVTGTWSRIVCFLDYNELYEFNFATPPPLPGHPRPALDTEEAIRLITMRIQVTGIQDSKPHPSPKTDPNDPDSRYDPSNHTTDPQARKKRKLNPHPATATLSSSSPSQPPSLPTVHFRGHSASVRPSWDMNANSKIRGCVRLTLEGEVHWTTWSIFHGEERWRSEGIQVGGVRSGRGVLGFWCDKDFDEHGPAGPTAFWKVSDVVDEGGEEEEERRRRRRMAEMHALHMPLY